MRKLLVALFISSLSLSFYSCTETIDESLDEFYKESFDAWMSQHHPDIARLESGLYIEWIKKNPNGKRLNEGYWMQLNYTGRTLNGTIYTSRSKEIAKQLGYFSYTTHFIPEFMQFAPSASTGDDYQAYLNLAFGQVEALRLMHEGDSVRLYIPAFLGYGYGFSGNTGFYQQSVTVEASKPIIMDMGLKEVVSDPIAYEKKRVERYAIDSLGVKNSADTIAFGVYMKKLLALPEGDSIGKDSSISVYYTGKYMDGFVFDTNIDSVAKAHKIYNSEKTYTPLDLTPGGETTVTGFSEALLKMRRGEKAVVIFTSPLGYGVSGKGDIPAYTPLVFELYVQTVDEKK